MELLPLFVWAVFHLPSPPSLHRPVELTPIPDSKLIRLLEETHVKVIGHVPLPARVSLLRALVRFEGVPRNHNLGNVGGPPGLPYHRIGRGRYLSFDTFDDAAVALLTLLHDRCSGALEYANTGDPLGFALRLRRCGYHETDPEVYGRNLKILTHQRFD